MSRAGYLPAGTPAGPRGRRARAAQRAPDCARSRAVLGALLPTGDVRPVGARRSGTLSEDCTGRDWPDGFEIYSFYKIVLDSRQTDVRQQSNLLHTSLTLKQSSCHIHQNYFYRVFFFIERPSDISPCGL